MTQGVRIFTALTVLIVFLCSPVTSMAAGNEAANDVKLKIDGKWISTEVPPRIVNDRTMVPLRVILENLGAKVLWFPKTRQVQIEKKENDILIALTLDSKLAVINGSTKTIDVAPYVVEGRTLVPIRYISEWMGAFVKWKPETRTVVISHSIPQSLTFTFNGQAVESETKPQIIEGISYVSLKALAEELGYDFELTGSDTAELKKTVAVEHQGEEDEDEEKDEETIEIEADSKYFVKNDEKMLIRQPVIGVEDSYMIAPEAIGKLFDIQANWDKENGTVEVYMYSRNLNHLQDVHIEKGQVILKTGSTMEGKPEFFTLSYPSRFVIDLPNTVLDERLMDRDENTLIDEGVLVLDVEEHSLIKQIRVSQFDSHPAIVRVVLDLKEKRKFILDQKVPGQISLRASKEVPAEDPMVVVLDAGHGGKDPGALGFTSQEKDINLTVVKKVLSLLKDEKSIKVIPTRTTDVFISLEKRTVIANNHHADLFLSIHSNSFPNNSKVTGVETYYLTADGLVFAKILHRHHLEATEFINRGLKTARFYVLRHTTMPAVLLELGFVSNKNQEKQLNDPAMQDRIAKAVVESLLEYRKVMKENEDQ